MKKRMISLILALCMALSLTACGQQSETPPAQDETLTPQTEQTPTVEPAAEPEPQTIGDAQLDEAVALGIIDLETALRADELATEAEAVRMLRVGDTHGYGRESTFLNAMENAADPNRAACRYWFASGIFHSYCEAYYNEPASDWLTYVETMETRQHDHRTFNFVDACNFGVYHYSALWDTNADSDGYVGSGSLIDLCPDADTIPIWSTNKPSERVAYRECGNDGVADRAFKIFDRRTGEKVLDMDENQLWRPAEKMTIGEAAKAALRYYYSFEDPAVKVSVADAGTYDKSIITDELLNKSTTLPANSCANIPAEWHATCFGKMRFVSLGALGDSPDKVVRETDIQIAKSAGFNVIRLGLSFSYLQAPNVEAGMVNETRLKELDAILAMCMENDVHLQIACFQYQDFKETDSFYDIKDDTLRGPYSDEEIKNFSVFWGMLARRYADIPNEYLSFNLYNEAFVNLPETTEAEYERCIGSAVDAIRAASPERTLLADIQANGLTGESMAKRGVALSVHFYLPYGFTLLDHLPEEKWKNRDYIESVNWPFALDMQYYNMPVGTVVDADAILDLAIGNSPSPNDTRALCERYGVGFFDGEFSIAMYQNYSVPYRYRDDTFYGYYADMLAMHEREGIGWSFYSFDSNWGLVYPYPVLEGVEYEKVGYYYVDTQMRDFFKSWAK